MNAEEPSQKYAPITNTQPHTHRQPSTHTYTYTRTHAQQNALIGLGGHCQSTVEWPVQFLRHWTTKIFPATGNRFFKFVRE